VQAIDETGKLVYRRFKQPLLTPFMRISGISHGVDHPEYVDFYSRSKKTFCGAEGDFSDATAPGLTATSALTT
ncbi:hypothetical protein, partial [Klebsiella pneumoniae]|uniref:hypothetical protein n=1 Tax=Klebsiella pneumoniae TaxID=573 RepID=UPI003B8EB8D2